MNRYGVIAQRHWAQWLPRQYAAISDLESFFTTLGEEVARQMDDLTDELIGEIQRSDSYLAHVVVGGAGCRVHDVAQGRLLSAAGRRLYR